MATTAVEVQRAREAMFAYVREYVEWWLAPDDGDSTGPMPPEGTPHAEYVANEIRLGAQRISSAVRIGSER